MPQIEDRGQTASVTTPTRAGLRRWPRRDMAADDVTAEAYYYAATSTLHSREHMHSTVQCHRENGLYSNAFWRGPRRVMRIRLRVYLLCVPRYLCRSTYINPCKYGTSS